MIRVLFTAILFLVFGPAYSQKISVTYYDSSWLLTTKKSAKYYRTGVIDTIKYQFHGEVRDYYMNAKLQMKGRYRANIKVDTFYFYYPTGQLKTKGRYLDNVRYGVWTNYYEHGKIRDKVVFNRDFIAVIEYYDKDGNPKMVNGTGEWETEYYNDLVKKVITIRGAYKDTLRDGKWNYYQHALTREGKHELRLECTEVYKEGKFVKGGYFFGGDGNRDLRSPVYNVLPEALKFENTENWMRTHTLSIESYPYLKFLPKLDTIAMQNAGEWYKVDQTPKFRGGISNFYSYVDREFKCSGADLGTDNVIYVEFVVDSTGFIRKGSVKFMESDMAQVCKDRLVSTLESCPKWTPGHVTELKKDVPVKVSLPVNLKLKFTKN